MAKNIVPTLRLGCYHYANFSRNYSKWFHRRPVKVILPEDLVKKGSRKQKVNVERQISFVENFEKPDPFLLDDLIKEHGDPRSENKKNTDIDVSTGVSTSGHGFESDTPDRLNSENCDKPVCDTPDRVNCHETRVNSVTPDKPVFVDETVFRAKMRQDNKRSIKPFESQTSASIEIEKNVSSYDSFSDSVNSSEENIFVKRDKAQISDTNIDQTHFFHDVTDLSKSITDEDVQRSKGRQVKEKPKTFLSKTNRNANSAEHFSDDSDYDSVSSDEEPEKIEGRETVSETSGTSKKQIKFTKLPDSDTKLSKVMLIAKSRKIRKKKELIVLEGKRLIQDFLKSGIMPVAVFFSRLDDISMFDFGNNDVQLYKITYKKLSLWSSLVTSPGVIGVFRTPNLVHKEHSKDALPVTVICDNIRDPGNMGSIIRIVAGVGCEQIIATKGCVDIWDTKVLRAAGGAHLRVPISTEVEWSEVPNCIPYNHNVFIADSCSDSSSSDLRTPLLPYFGIDFSGIPHSVLVIGGETGLSKEAMSLVQEGGARLNVPLSGGVESLNSSIALAVILFEMKKQMMHWSQKETTQAVKL